MTAEFFRGLLAKAALLPAERSARLDPRCLFHWMLVAKADREAVPEIDQAD